MRTRVAPSPTGDPHVGTAYIALFNYCLAKKNGGEFTLRIEDTDRTRSSQASEKAILDSLHWLGLSWDNEPFRQSARTDIYARFAEQLVEDGHAFRCFCSDNTLAAMREAQQGGSKQGYDGRCLHLSPVEISRNMANHVPHTIRMCVPSSGVCFVNDILRGQVAMDWSQVDMQVLIKSDGQPTYHLANVVDDHLMGITHVLRGEEWLTSAPKHLLLYSYFGWEPPVLCHMPLLRNPDKSKLSKRKNPTSILYYRRMGVIPEALLNYLGLMAWSMPDGRVRFPLEAMVESFDLSRVSLGGPVFDEAKLFWLNGKWLQNMPDDQFAERAADWASNWREVVPLVKSRVHVFSDLVPLAGYLYSGTPTFDPRSMLVGLNLDVAKVRQMLFCTLVEIDRMPAFDKATVETLLRRLSNNFGMKLRDFLRPFYVATSGRVVALPLFDVADILGKDIFRSRVRAALDILGAPSETEQRVWGMWLDGATHGVSGSVL